MHRPCRQNGHVSAASTGSCGGFTGAFPAIAAGPFSVASWSRRRNSCTCVGGDCSSSTIGIEKRRGAAREQN